MILIVTIKSKTMIKLSYEHENNILHLKSRFDSLEISNHDQKNPSLRSSHSRCFVRKGVLRNFARKHLCRVSFSINYFLLKRRLWHRCFLVNFAKFLRTPFLQNASRKLLLYFIMKPFVLYWFDYFEISWK